MSLKDVSREHLNKTFDVLVDEGIQFYVSVLNVQFIREELPTYFSGYNPGYYRKQVSPSGVKVPEDVGNRILKRISGLIKVFAESGKIPGVEYMKSAYNQGVLELIIVVDSERILMDRLKSEESKRRRILGDQMNEYNEKRIRDKLPAIKFEMKDVDNEAVYQTAIELLKSNRKSAVFNAIDGKNLFS
jgi:hypothetical protein